jgi:transposase
VSAGMVKTTIVAIDGTKIEANAAGAKNLTEEQLEKLAAEVLQEAEAIDAEEDRLYGDRRGDEIPPELVDRTECIEWMRQQLAGRKPTRSGEKRINATDPDSRVMKTPSGYLQGFNAQLAVSDDHVIVAAELSNEASDVTLLQPMIEQTEGNLEAAGAEETATILADAGYLSTTNVALETEAQLLIAPTTRDNLEDALQNRSEGADDAAPSAASQGPRHDDARRRLVMEAYVSKQVTASEAAAALLAPINSVYHWAWHLRKYGHPRPVQRRRAPRGPSAKEIMLERWADPDARAAYKRRGVTVEPVIGHLKEVRGLRRFLHRGLDACRCELRLMATAQNLRRAWSISTARSRPRCQLFEPTFICSHGSFISF